MRLLKINIKNMPRFREDIDIDFITKQRVAEDDKEKLFHIFLIFMQIRYFLLLVSMHQERRPS